VAAETILVADDNAQNRALAQATLEDEGYRIVFAVDGPSTVAAARTEDIDCILMDVRMPVFDGVEACEQIRQLPGGDEIAIVFVTAQREVETFDRASRAGGDDFLTKPYRPDELLVRVKTALRLRRLATERGELYAELKLQRDRLQRLELHKEQLVAFLVHDLKNPVNSIELLAKLVQRTSDNPVRVRSAASKIVDETASLLRMITNLLDLSKGDEARLVPVRSATDLVALADHVRTEMAARAEASHVGLVLELAPMTVSVDADLVGRVIANLVDNAIRHAPEDSRVVVSATYADHVLELRIADAGAGVPEEHRARVFERFARAEEGKHTMRSNRGLGLAFCKLAVEAHGGKIWVEDNAPGAVFVVRIPDDSV